MTVVYFKSSLENNITNLKSCQKKETNLDESLSCSDCMCIATDGYSSKEFSEVIKNQKEAEKKYRELEKQLSEYEKKVTELENTLLNYENPNNDGYFTNLLNENWKNREEKLTNEFQKNETSFRISLINEVKEEIQNKSQIIQSQLDEQSGEIAKIKGTGVI